MTGFRQVALFVCISTLIGSAVSVASTQGACAPTGAPGGEWRSYGHDLTNTRTQDQEHVISAQNAYSLSPAWNFSTANVGDSGAVLAGTPVVADGCVFVATSSGRVIALNADDGSVVWVMALKATVSGVLSGGAVVGSVSVEYGRVYAMVNSTPDPYAVALDEATGAVVWAQAVNHAGMGNPLSGTAVNASPVIFDGMFFFGESGPDLDAASRPHAVILDAFNGQILASTPTVSDADFAAGFAGGGIWGTAAVDTVRKYLYVGTSNPYSKTKEPRYANAIIKVDVDRTRPTFGQIVDALKGETDHYVPGLERQPACQAIGPSEPGFSATCVQMDLDFGASPNLFRNPQGDLIVGCLQKSGVYHAAYADTMEAAWQTTVGVLWYGGGNAASTALVGTHVIVATNPGIVSSIATSDGTDEWVSPMAFGPAYEPVSVANGVTYGVDNAGNLRGIDVSSGVPVLVRPMAIDVSEETTATSFLSSTGVAIARNTVYAEVQGQSNGHLVAYRTTPSSPSIPLPSA